MFKRRMYALSWSKWLVRLLLFLVAIAYSTLLFNVFKTIFKWNSIY